VSLIPPEPAHILSNFCPPHHLLVAVCCVVQSSTFLYQTLFKFLHVSTTLHLRQFSFFHACFHLALRWELWVSLAIVLYVLSCALRRLWFDPQIDPSPGFARFSRLWLAHMVAGRKTYDSYRELHKKYGRIVRQGRIMSQFRILTLDSNYFTILPSSFVKVCINVLLKTSPFH